MKDVDGVEVFVDDLVYWRENKYGAFCEIGKIIRVRESLGLFSVKSTKYYDGVYKAARNVRRMPDDRAMLWKLENL